MSESSKYQITIKSANQKVDDYVTDCESTWTIRRLKQQIAETHVIKPIIDDQRLIYGGNILKDNLSLKEVFFKDSLCTDLTNANKTDFTIHLVCAQKAIYNTNNNASNVRNSQQTQPSTSNTNKTTNSRNANNDISPSVSMSGQSNRPTLSPHHQTTAPNYVNGENAQNTSTTTSTNINRNSPAPNGANVLNNLFSFPAGTISSNQQTNEIVSEMMRSQPMRQQLAIFEQMANMVAAQIVNIARNNNNININNIDNNNFIPTNNVINNNTGENNLNNMNNNNNINNIDNNNDNNNNPEPGVGENFVDVQEGGEFGPAARGARARAPAEPVLQVVDGAGNQVDVIDWVYCTLKAMVLMLAIFLHASMYRIVSILGIMGFGYLFNRFITRRAQNNRARSETIRARNLEPGGPNGHDNDNNNNNNPETNDQMNERANLIDAATVANNNNNRQISFFKFCYLVVTDFLASLVP